MIQRNPKMNLRAGNDALSAKVNVVLRAMITGIDFCGDRELGVGDIFTVGDRDSPHDAVYRVVFRGAAFFVEFATERVQISPLGDVPTLEIRSAFFVL